MHLLPEVELFVIYAVMALVLAIRPEGLFTRVAARRIRGGGHATYGDNPHQPSDRVLLVLEFLLPEWLLALSTVAFAKGLVVLGLLVLWRAGLVSFGQALYFAGGAYAAGLPWRSTPVSTRP